jgi:hypothetical protein
MISVRNVNGNITFGWRSILLWTLQDCNIHSWETFQYFAHCHTLPQFLTRNRWSECFTRYGLVPIEVQTYRMKTVPRTKNGCFYRRGRSYPCNRPWGPTFSRHRLTNGGKVVSPTRRPPFTAQKNSWNSFLLEAESTPGPQCGWKD